MEPYSIMKYLSIILIILLTSCNPCKRLWKRCPPVIIDSVRVDSITRLDTITLRYPGDTVRIGEETLRGFGIIIDTEKQKITRKGKIIEFICKEDSLNAVISSLEVKLTREKQNIKEVPIYLPQKYIPKAYKYSFWILIALLVSGGLYVFIRLKSFK